MKRLHRNHTCNPISANDLRGYNRLLDAIFAVPEPDPFPADALMSYIIQRLPLMDDSAPTDPGWMIQQMCEENPARWN